jgi:hypothetical protein
MTTMNKKKVSRSEHKGQAGLARKLGNIQVYSIRYIYVHNTMELDWEKEKRPWAWYLSREVENVGKTQIMTFKIKLSDLIS